MADLKSVATDKNGWKWAFIGFSIALVVNFLVLGVNDIVRVKEIQIYLDGSSGYYQCTKN